MAKYVIDVGRLFEDLQNREDPELEKIAELIDFDDNGAPTDGPDFFVAEEYCDDFQACLDVLGERNCEILKAEKIDAGEAYLTLREVLSNSTDPEVKWMGYSKDNTLFIAI